MYLFNEFLVAQCIDYKILLVHGGLYQELNTLDQLNHSKQRDLQMLIKLDYYEIYYGVS